MSVNLKKISTESRNKNTMDIDRVSTLEILEKINNEDKTIAYAVEKALPAIATVVDKVYGTFLNGGRLIYMGAGTSGRIGILDAVECPPTYGVDYDMVQCLMAGGSNAFVKAVEGAEDSKEMAVSDLKRINLSEKDIVIGIAASGRTPYVLGGIEYANKNNVNTCCITTSASSPLEQAVKYPIVVLIGAEPITGSTRMKSGTAQKMVCNMISTSAMIKMGKVYENLMIDLKATNEKLIERSLGIISTVTGFTRDEALEQLKRYGTIKRIIFSYLTNISDIKKIDEYLEKCHGSIRDAVKLVEAKNEN